MEKLLGKIADIRMGFGGYQDVWMGINIRFSFKDNGTVNTWLPLEGNSTKATIDDIKEMLNMIGKSSLSDLNNVPVEVTLENQMYKSFRILEEVL